MEAEQKNGPAQSPPSRPGLAVNPFLGWLAPVLLALEVKAKRGEGKEGRQQALEDPGPSAWWHLASLLQLQGRLRATCQSASPPPKYFQEMVGGGQEMAQGSVFTKAYTSSPLHYTWFSPA